MPRSLAVSAPRLDDARGGLPSELVEDAAVEARLGAREAATTQDRQPLEPAAQVLERSERGRVAPVQVVDEERERAADGEVRGQPVEPVVERERPGRVGGRRLAAAGDEVLDEAGRPGEELARSAGGALASAGS